ncbi:TspO/MBR related protein [Hoeflea marina]|uniref:TspO/MBR related protein n=1 Tax=Hoeflea marina TaxID=274592 RepID=A0A317PKT0_9HYPH|nr:TspO/MBR family protein [Hoeflea marina]PWW00456.1 TspO/MBR related protein [Hoeflea marina]
MSRAKTLLLFLALTVGGGLAIGFLTAPGEWYRTLAKPAFNPPNWIFGPVWTVLYVMVAVAGARVWNLDPSGRAMKAWVVQMALNFAWSPLFFAAQRPDLALPVVVALFAAILVFIASTWRTERPSALLFVPYAAWVGFASLLNASIWWLNRG